MTDIVERLRHHILLPELAEEAADEIERLRTRMAIQFGMHPGGDLAKATGAEIERLRAALKIIINECEYMAEARTQARAALELKP